jgi:hypothetical protein
MQNIKRESKRVGTLKPKHVGTSWKEVSLDELKMFFAVTVWCVNRQSKFTGMGGKL